MSERYLYGYSFGLTCSGCRPPQFHLGPQPDPPPSGLGDSGGRWNGLSVSHGYTARSRLSPGVYVSFHGPSNTVWGLVFGGKSVSSYRHVYFGSRSYIGSPVSVDRTHNPSVSRPVRQTNVL